MNFDTTFQLRKSHLLSPDTVNRGISKQGVEYFFTSDYCLIIYGLRYRDITGRDLNYIDWIKSSLTPQYMGTYEFALEYLNFFGIDYTGHGVKNDLKNLPRHCILDTLEVFLERVHKNPMSRDIWLKNVFHLNGNTFNNYSAFEDVPMTEFLQMIKTFNEHQKELEQQYKRRSRT